MARYDLPDEAWTLIQPLLPAHPASPRAGRPWAAHRMIINGMFWGLCSGAPWHDLPERYGPWKTVYNRFNLWSKSGVINIIFNRLLSSFDSHDLADWSATALDGSNIRALKCAAGAPKKQPDIAGDNGLGRSRGGFGTKIHMATDGSGLPLNIVLSPGQVYESQCAQRLLDGIGVHRQNGSMKRCGHVVQADRAYSGHTLRNELINKGIKTITPRKFNQKMESDGRLRLDRDACRNRNRNRNVVERCFGRLKEYRRIATRYDKTARNYLAMVNLGCIRLIYQRLCN
ncbi:IS5 family transposase [Klebsiella pneumoniae]|uniref:IS5 family transposase n=1 Tax=Klebsiella pneumoniae TaxID=573 RepID=UPI001156EA78|nr:IS5 family transposase [Klebsiella pneumoniae]ELA0994042.1 IS5 family transposase [Klebsiella pneumoniae]MCU8675170.1 IS5 family transposase [Klebsiella pneumoniae]MCU8688529.1 IS5 family transposase [Klebsiella pneumoniae]HBR3463629.1 IS5 family transposase [Klebsiella pneumoniae]HCB0101319.1 IS5 family transposase [Klebsiella pneumoniae]